MQRWVQQSHLGFEIRDLEKIKNKTPGKLAKKNTRLALSRFGDSLEVARSKVFLKWKTSKKQTSTSTFSRNRAYCVVMQGIPYRQRLKQSTIIQPWHGHWIPVHDLEQFSDVIPLHDQQLLQRLSAILLISGQDHLPHGHNSLSLEEHVLSADEANALCTELLGLSSICWSLCVRAHLRIQETTGTPQRMQLDDIRCNW